MSDETHEPEETVVDGEPEDIQSDNTEFVGGELQITVMPDSVSMHFQVKPTSDEGHITNLTASFVLKAEGMVQESFAGGSQQALKETAEGQGFVGDLGVDAKVFEDRAKGGLFGMVAGVCKDKEGNPHNFIFEKQFHLD